MPHSSETSTYFRKLDKKPLTYSFLHKLVFVFKRFLRSVFTSGMDGSMSQEGVRKALIINLFTLVGLIFMLGFAVENIFEQQYMLSFILFAISTLLFLNSVFLRIFKKFQIAGYFVTISLFLLLFYFLVGGNGCDKILWYYTFPFIAFFILGRKSGALISAFLFLITFYFLWNPVLGMSVCPPEIKVRFLASYMAVNFLALFFEYVRSVTYDSLLDANEKKSFYLTQVLQQKEEIMVQAEQLAQTNQELEKYSIAASQTDNAILIMDQDGNFEWVNNGFTKLYGYTFQEFLEEKGSNILNVSSNVALGELLQNIREHKKSVHYEAFTNTKAGQKIWVQTTITPIMDKNDEVKKLIAIDSDITELKQAEEAIRQQKEEILSQRDELEIQKEKLEDQNENIKSSIRYALTIQQAFLLVDKHVKTEFGYFVLNRPKDIVSGDFYWFSKIRNKPTGEKYIVAAVVDCTGHGVPGAFMSMLGNLMLNEIVDQKNQTDPAIILEMMNIGVNDALKQQRTENQDGMDASICFIEKLPENKGAKITYSGANRPLFYYESIQGQLFTVKGDTRTIGGLYSRDVIFPFSNKTIFLQPDDMIFMGSDGLVAQYSPDFKKFGTARLKEILFQNATKTLELQQKAIEIEIDRHQQTAEQTDDILFMGIKI